MKSWGSATGWLGACILTVAGSVSAGCGRSVSHVGTEGSSQAGESGVGGSSGGDANAGGKSGTGAAGAGGFSGNDCKAIQQHAQQAADTSCEVDSDCERPSHTHGDCLDCGAVTNVASEQSSLDAVRSACEPFFAQGCEYPLHPCPAYQAKCVAGVCGD